jgi:c-di-GMP-binding flagellar brake protein YcgR
MTDKKEGKDDNERLDIRVPIDINITIKTIEINNRIKHLKNNIYGTIENISCGGMLLHSGANINKHTKFNFNIMLFNKSLNISTEIIRKNKGSNLDYYYGCKFLNLSLHDEKILRKFIFNKQIELNK